MSGLRIVAGKFRGRRLRVPAGSTARPTGERVREALFSIVGAQVQDARVLDAYSGSGALGFEALSRGAAEVTFVEADRRMCRALEAAAAALNIESQCRVLHGQTLALVGRGAASGPFDLVLADPPYAGGEGGRFLEAVACSSLLATAGQLVLERDSRVDPCPGGLVGPLERSRTARYGDSSLDFFSIPS